MNPEAPFVSILVPVFGVEKYIERCARSLFEQTYSNLEFVFVDDVSPDKSVVVKADEQTKSSEIMKITLPKIIKSICQQSYTLVMLIC